MKYLSIVLAMLITATTIKSSFAQSVINSSMISFSGKVGVETTNPQASLDVVGNVKITDGTQGIGKVLTSDANGNAAWQTPKPTPFVAGNGIVIKGDTIYAVSNSDAVIDLQTKVDAQAREIDDLKNTMAQMQVAMSQCCNSFYNSMSQQSNINATTEQSNAASLAQNVPNPFNQTSYIKYYIPTTATSGVIIINDLDGRLIKEFDNLSTGYSQVNINAGELASGTYMYTLYVNGVKIDTRQMVLTK